MGNKELLSIGQSFSFDFSFTQDQVNLFAEISGDNNPIHLDESYAAQTIFKKRIIHGFLGGSIFSKVFGTIFPGSGTIYLKQTMTFLKPMYTNESYTAVFEVKEVNREKHRATIETKIYTSEKQEVISGEALVLNENKI